jgi:hypothetical protein
MNGERTKMTKLKLSDVQSDKPVKLAIELSAAVHRDLTAYAEVLSRETGQTVEPAKLVAPMLVRFMASDRGFAKARLRVQKSEVQRSQSRSPDPASE